MHSKAWLEFSSASIFYERSIEIKEGVAIIVVSRSWMFVLTGVET